MTAYIVQVSMGDTPQGTLEYQTIFAVGLTLFAMTFIVNIFGQRLARGSDHEPPHRRSNLGGRLLCGALFALGLPCGLVGRCDVGWCCPNRLVLLDQLSEPPCGQSRAFTWFGGLLVSRTPHWIDLHSLGCWRSDLLQEYGQDSRLSRFIAINIGSLAGVPSVIYGLLGLGIFVRTFGLGRSLIAGAATLALLVLPIVVIASIEALRAVPGTLREAALGLGATRWQVIRHVVLRPHCRVFSRVVF